MADNELKYLQERIEAIKDRNTIESDHDSCGPLGLDIGTSHIIVAQDGKSRVSYNKQLNAFFTVPNSRFARTILNKNDLFYFEQDKEFYIIGYAAEEFANMFNTVTRRSMQKGIVCSDENDGLEVIRTIVDSLINRPGLHGETVCYAVPGEPLENYGSVIYHDAIIKKLLGNMGYNPIPINEGMAIVLSEMANDDYTGIGINMGGGMCNVCLSYMSYPVITYSMQSAGDYIDSSAGISVGEPATKVKQIKEQELNLLKNPGDRVITALHIFYEDIICRLTGSLQRALSSADSIPAISRPVPIVLSGGTVIPEGCVDWFQKALGKVSLPVEISSVRVAADPLTTTSKGALIMARTESE